MLNACVNTIVRNGDEFLELCITTILPYIKCVIITVDSRSNDRTLEIVKNLSINPKVKFSIVDIVNPKIDLVDARNKQLEAIQEEFGWIVDADEFHPFVKKIVLGNKDAYGFLAWSPWNKTHAHKATSKYPIGRIFRMKPTLKWRGKWGKERLYDEDKKVFDNMELLPMRYIHLTHLKKEVWRKEMGQERVADGKHLSKLPENIIKILNENLPNLSRN